MAARAGADLDRIDGEVQEAIRRLNASEAAGHAGRAALAREVALCERGIAQLQKTVKQQRRRLQRRPPALTTAPQLTPGFSGG